MQHFSEPLAFEKAGRLRNVVPDFQQVPDEIALEIRRLHAAGFALIALGAGDDGKSPRGPVDCERWSLRRVLGAIRGGTMYGIRLDGLVVVDVDTNTPEAHEYVARRFGASAVQVATARGVHHYYRLGDQVPPAGIHLAGIDVDIKAGPNSYVVGPSSIRPDLGLIYTARGEALTFDGLPDFQDREPLPRDLRGVTIEIGKRNDHLFRQACQFAHDADSQTDLFDQLIAQRDFELDDPDTFPEAEVAKIAKSVWGYREKGSLWAGRNSIFKVNRMVFDKLENREAGQDAAMLLLYLASNHGHKDRDFVIVPSGIQKAGHLRCMSDRSLYRAISVLVEECILLVVGQQGRKKVYRLNKAIVG